MISRKRLWLRSGPLAISDVMVGARFRVEQPVRVQDEVAHLCMVHGALRRILPCVISRFVARERPDKVQLGKVLELDAANVFQLTADDKVKKLLGIWRVGHFRLLRIVRPVIWPDRPVRIRQSDAFDALH